MAYGVLKDSSGNELANTWVRLTQGTKSITALTGADGFYVIFDGQVCAASDQAAGGCYSASTAQSSTSTWAFAKGTQSSVISILGPAILDGDGEPIKPTYNAAAAWPTGTWASAKVVSGSTTFATVIHPAAPQYTFGIANGTAYSRDWRFTRAP